MNVPLVRGAVVGGALGLPLGLWSGSHLATVLQLTPGTAGRAAFLFLVSLGWVAWAAFIGAMLSSQAEVKPGAPPPRPPDAPPPGSPRR